MSPIRAAAPFARFKVLFIGYSHNDLIMTYLGLGLRAESRRWILTDQPDNELYRRLDITPVTFGPGQYADIEHGLTRWGEIAGMGLLDHRSRLADLLAREPPEIPEEISYMEQTLADPIRVQIFAEAARDFDDAGRAEAWLSWVAQQPQVQALLDEHAVVELPGRQLAYWIADQFAAHETLNGAAFALVRTRRFRIHGELWWALLRRLRRVPSPRDEWTTPWILLLLADRPSGASNGALEHLLSAASFPEERPLILLLVEALLRPSTSLAPTWPGATTRIQVVFGCDHHQMTQAVGAAVRPHLDDLAEDLLGICEQHLRAALLILASAGSVTSRFDPLSFGRSAIEPHSQDQFPEAVDALIDLARDCLENLIARDPAASNPVLERWINSGIALLRRLAVHGTGYRSDLTGSDKLSWLLDHDLLWDFAGQHEVYRLLADSLPHVKTNEIDRLVDQILNGPPPEPQAEADDEADDEVERQRAYRVYNAIVWLNRYVPAVTSVQAAMHAQQTEHPDWGPREHPDLHRYTFSVDFRQMPLPISADTLHNLIATRPEEALTALRAADERLAAEHSSGFSRTAAEAVTTVVSEHPRDGLALIAADPGDERGFHRAVLQGWRASPSDIHLADEIASAVARLDLAALADEIATMLTFNARNARTAWLESTACRDLATATWANLPPEPVSEPHSKAKLVNTAYNSTPGKLALYWADVFLHQWQQTEDSWQEMPDWLRDALEGTLVPSPGGNTNSTLAAAVYLSRLHAFWMADRLWCGDRLMPLLDWTIIPSTAGRLWPAYLSGGRWNDSMLDAGMLDNYLTAAHAIPPPAGADDIEQALQADLASITVQTTLALDSNGWIARLTTAMPEARRAGWLEWIANLLQSGPDTDPEYQWQRWLHHYAARRIVDTVPVALSTGEANALVETVVQLDASFAEAVTLIESTDANLNHDRFILQTLAQTQANAHPEATARLLAHLLAGTDPIQLDDIGELHTIVQTVKGHVPNDLVDRIRERAAALNMPDALTW